MALPDGARGKRIPTLSWDSVVGGADGVEGADDEDDVRVDDPSAAGDEMSDEVIFGHVRDIALSPLSLDLTPRADEGEALNPVSGSASPIELKPLRLDPPTAPTPITPITPIAPTPSSSLPASIPSPSPSPSLSSMPTMTPLVPPTPTSPVPLIAAPSVGTEPSGSSRTIDDTTPQPLDPVERPQVRTVPPAVIVPALGDVTSGPERIDAGPAATTTDVLPTIQEATPVEAAPLETSPAGAIPVAEHVAPALPSLPSIPVPAPAQAAASAEPFRYDPTAAPTSAGHQPPRRVKRSGAKLFVTLVVLGGLVAAGVVFGQPYLFPSEWDDATAPYADAVESVRGSEFVEPLSVIAEPTAEFATRLPARLAAFFPDEVAAWRALGLASGAVDESGLAGPIGGWQDAVYAPEDGQVYHDLGAAGDQLDAQLVQAMTAAALDQDYAWSAEQAKRTLDAAAATSGEVLRQSREVQTASTFSVDVDPAPTAQVNDLPPVIGYRLLAPHVFAEFEYAASDAANLLDGLGANGPGPLGRAVGAAATVPTMIDGDVVVGSPMVRDRSFWFLVFGSFLDGPTAFAASEAVVENALTSASRGATSCVYATFAGGAVEQTETLRSALTAWSAAAPAEFASSFTVLPDGTLQLSSCDPGSEFAGASRPGVVSELIAWRAVELATYAAVTGTGEGVDDEVLANVWALIGASSVPLDVATLPPGTSPAAIAAAARDGVAALYNPSG